jgi:hypothetical protein
MMLHWSPRGADQLFGTPHISAFSAVYILSADIVLRSTIAGPSSVAGERGPLRRGARRATVAGPELGRIPILLAAAQPSWTLRAMIRLKLVHGTLTPFCQVKKTLFFV